MPFTLTMPKLSPTMTEGTITCWHKKEGDQVEVDDLLFEVATDKATVEYNAIDEGVLRKILIQEDQEAVVNQPVAIFAETADESIEEFLKAMQKEKAEKEVSQETLKTEDVKKETTKSSGGQEHVGMAKPAFIPESPLENYSFEFPSENYYGHIKASPLAKKMAKEKGLDLLSVKGSGPGGRIIEKDLELAQPALAFTKRDKPQKAAGSYREEKLSPMRKSIGQRLQEAKTFIPHFYVTQKIRMDKVIEMRSQLKDQGIKVTFNDFIARACALTLEKHQTINSGYNSKNDTIIRYETIDLSIAVSVDGGLITPIVRHANYKNLMELSLEIKQLAKKARDQKLETHEYKGGSFTLSNLGMFGISEFQAIINPPQAAILAVSGMEEVPLIINNKITPSTVMHVSLSSDHRVIDGAAAAQFLKDLKELIESPALLLI